MTHNADSKAAERYRDMTETPVPRLITRLSIPTIISMLVTAIYNAADTFFVGRISTEATAAVGLAFSAMAVIQALGFFCGQGSGNYLSRMLGAGKQEEAEKMAATGLALSMILGGGMSKAGQALLDGILPRFRHHMFHACKDTKFALATLGNNAGIFGCFHLALQAQKT